MTLDLADGRLACQLQLMTVLDCGALNAADIYTSQLNYGLLGD
jgi:hypothetical protein